MQWSYHVSTNTNPFENLATEELLLHSLRPGEVVLYLWRNADTVVLGKNQNAWRECLVEEFEADGGRVARRLSGGGAVYHDLGNLNFTFLAEGDSYDVERHTEVLRIAAASFGISVQRSGRNDILADGRKFSGNAFYAAGGRRFHHGTILIGADMGRLGRFLVPSKQKLEAKGVASVRARVVNLSELNPSITPGRMQHALLDAMGRVYGTAGTLYSTNRIGASGMREAEAKYASDDWRLGRKIPHTRQLTGRFDFGQLELLFQEENGVAKAVFVHTDALDPDWAPVLQTALTGIAINEIAQHAARLATLPQEVREAVKQLVSA